MAGLTKEDREILVAEIVAAVRVRNSDVGLTDDEQRWVRMAIQKEAQSIELRKAIIEKTFTGVVWMCLVGVGSMFVQWATAHGFKP